LGVAASKQLPMTNLVPVTDELLVRARDDHNLRRALISEHLQTLTNAMRKARNPARSDTQATRQVQEGARLAVRLTEILQALDGRNPPDNASEPPVQPLQSRRKPL
jgi:hypothetical protein